MRALAYGFMDLLFPPSCFLCGRASARPLCGPCLSALRSTPAIPLRPPLASLVAASDYRGEVEPIVRRFKYPDTGFTLDPAPIAVLAALLGEAAAALPRPELVVPVPLHPRRLRARGFNPAGLLARRLARDRRIAFDPVALRRTRDTPSQTGFSAAGRRRNVRGAFTATHPVPGKIWLVDDVVTTGSTLEAAARALARAGAHEIHGIAVAATP